MRLLDNLSSWTLFFVRIKFSKTFHIDYVTLSNLCTDNTFERSKESTNTASKWKDKLPITFGKQN